MASNISKPACFGDEDYYDDRTRGCLRCNYRSECAVQVNQKINHVAARGWSSATTTTRKPLTSSTAATVARTTHVPGVVRNMARESVYNFDSPVLPQLSRYVGYSVAEVCLEELHTLITQSRNDFINNITQSTKK